MPAVRNGGLFLKLKGIRAVTTNENGAGCLII